MAVALVAALAGGSISAATVPAAAATTASQPTDSPTSTPTPSQAVALPSVSIAGAVRDGSVLAVRVANTGWGAEPDSVAIQWRLEGEPVPDATRTKFRLTKSMVGKRVSVFVTAEVAGEARVSKSAFAVVRPGISSEQSLRNKLLALVAGLPGDYAISIRELDGGKRTVSIGGGSAREPASTSKVFLAYAVYRRIDSGSLAYATRLASGLTVAQCLRAMIEPSDNYCAQDLWRRVGTGYLNALLKKNGFDDTHFWNPDALSKITSASDVVTLLTRLAEGRLLTKKSTARFLKLLQTQVWREGISPGLPADVRQASKPGTKWKPTGMVQTDAAIVWGKKTRYVIAIMGYQGGTVSSITKISRLVYKHLQGGFTKAFRYERQQMVATGSLALHAGVGTGSAPLASYRKGSRVEVIDSVRNWYLVRIAGRTGWVVNTKLTLRNVIR